MPTWEGANATAQSANRWMPSGANATWEGANATVNAEVNAVLPALNAVCSSMPGTNTPSWCAVTAAGSSLTSRCCTRRTARSRCRCRRRRWAGPSPPPDACHRNRQQPRALAGSGGPNCIQRRAFVSGRSTTRSTPARRCTASAYRTSPRVAVATAIRAHSAHQLLHSARSKPRLLTHIGLRARPAANELAGDPAVAPGGVVGGQVENETTKRAGGGWPARRSRGLSPVSGGSPPVPAQQGLWRHEPASSLRSGQGRRDSTQQGPVLFGLLRSVVAAVQHAELVPQDDDLDFLRAPATHRQPCPRGTGKGCDT